MRYTVDHDLHIHSTLSSCCKDPKQTPQAILDYAEKNGFKTVCLTDHFWDETVPGASLWYQKQDYKHICKSKPLPQGENARFLFGAETDMDKFMTVGVSPERLKELDFIIIPTTHLHMAGFTLEKDIKTPEARACLWTSRLAALLNTDLPWHKVGIAHLTCHLIGDHVETLSLIPDDTFHTLFEKAAKLGAGIELNFNSFGYENKKDLKTVLNVYKIARDAGCKFYFGSDAHSVASLEKAHANFENIIDLLKLKEEDKFVLGDR